MIRIVVMDFLNDAHILYLCLNVCRDKLNKLGHGRIVVVNTFIKYVISII